jgi:hypothetical protein
MEHNDKLINGTVLQRNISVDTFIVMGEITDFELIDKLVEEARKKIPESTVSRKTNVTAQHTDFFSLVHSVNFHDFLKIIKKDIQKIYKKNFVVGDVWANFYSKPQEDFAKMHNHTGATAFCGILYCTDGPGPGTFFPQYDINFSEKKGRFLLFSPILLHEARPFNYLKERITVAWNFSEIKNWEDYSNSFFIKEKISEEQIKKFWPN